MAALAHASTADFGDAREFLGIEKQKASVDARKIRVRSHCWVQRPRAARRRGRLEVEDVDVRRMGLVGIERVAGAVGVQLEHHFMYVGSCLGRRKRTRSNSRMFCTSRCYTNRRYRCVRGHAGLGAEVCLTDADLVESESGWGDATPQEENALTTSKPKR